MSTVFDAKIKEYLALKPTRFRVLKSLSLTQAIDPSTEQMQQRVSLVLARAHDFSGAMLYVELYGVRDLKFRQPSWSLIVLSNLEISRAPTAEKHERRWAVLDTEEGIISCSCYDFVAVVG